MKHLPARGRDEAVATANALLAEGLDVGIAVRTAIEGEGIGGASRPRAVTPRRHQEQGEHPCTSAS
jgi:hypothetical protein